MTMQNKQMNMDQVRQHLEGVDFPNHKEAMIQYMQDDAVPSDVTDLLAELPDRMYHNAGDVIEELERLK